MLILFLVLKDSLRTFFKSLSLSWSLGVRSLSLSWFLGSGTCLCPGPCGSGPCPFPGPCGLMLVLVLVLVLVLARTCFHYSDLFAYYCSVNAYKLVLIILTYVFLPSYCFASINMMSMV